MGRYSAKSNSKTSKNNSKLLIVIIVFVLLIFALFSLVYFCISQRKNSGKPENQIDALFSALKSNKIKAVDEFVSYEDIVSSLDESILNMDNKNNKSNLQKELFEDLEWSIKGVEFLDNQAVATVSVTNKDFKSIVTKWLKVIVEQDSVANDFSEDFLLKKLEEILVAEEEMRTATNLIIFDRIDDEWRIQANDNLIYLIFPGLDTINSVFN